MRVSFNSGKLWLILAMAVEFLMIVGTGINIIMTKEWVGIIGWLGRICFVLVPLVMAYRGKLVALWVAVFFLFMTSLAGVLLLAMKSNPVFLIIVVPYLFLSVILIADPKVKSFIKSQQKQDK